MPKSKIRERILAVYHKKRPDRIPCGIYSRYLKRGIVEREARNNGLGIIDYYPIVSMIAPPWHTISGYISEVKNTEFSVKIAWEDNKKIEIRTFETPVGNISTKIKKDPAYGSDWIDKFYISKPEDYKVLKYIIENTVLRDNFNNFSKIQEDLKDDGVVLGRIDRLPWQKLLIELAGPERLILDLYDHPALVEDIIATMEKKMDEVVKMAATSPAEVIWQPDNVTTDLTSPAYFEKYCLPLYNRYGELLHKHNKAYIVHMDGNLAGIKDLIAKSNFDAVESFTFPEGGGNLSYEEARHAWGDKAIIANFPASFCYKKEEEIKRYIREILGKVSPEDSFMLEVSEDIPLDQWQKTVAILAETMNSY